MKINWKKLEEKWRRKWEKAKIFEADPDPERKKCFVTFPYPYMNGPLHVGHGFTATRVDVYARFKRMQGYNTLFPWAWHWTGEPIVGAALRVKMGDQKEIRALKVIDGVPEEKLKKLVDPVYMAQYYTRESKKAVRRIGYSIDWRREFHTTSLEPTFSRFVEWQYNTLREMGYVAKGTHPVVWCPNCESPTGDHDRLEGEGVSPEEYTLIKFPFNNSYLPAATFRPETIYGVTNMFINPEATYVEAQVEDEKWIISKQAAEKLVEQLRKVKIEREFKGIELVGKFFRDPITKRKLPILPGWFVNSDSATGVVYSVPAHAPADWIAIKDLVENPGRLQEVGLDPGIVKNIKPISMISVEGFGEYPAVEIVKQLKIKDQFDPKVEEATNILYKKEFHTGVLKPICGKYAGKLVKTVKTELIEDFVKDNIADSIYDIPQEVICRCTTRCLVKILADQWFLLYSDPEWKIKTHEAADKANIYPETARSYFHDRMDWLREWACVRRTGLGTPLPWSPGWIVETLSDSTIYMAFYTINKHIKQHGIKTEQLSGKVFDYIFLEKGNVKKVAEDSGVEPAILEEMRAEFLYWYPVDLRISAKELIPNHLSFFLFQHTALFPRELWPRGISVNGMVMIEGAKMSKSKGNFVTLKNAINQHGADATRLTSILGAQGMDDPDWREKNASSTNVKLQSFHNFLNQLTKNSGRKEITSLDLWLLNAIQKRIHQVTEALETLKTRTAAEVGFFEIWNDIRWYLRRVRKPNQIVLNQVVNIWIRLLTPFIPYTCEEFWYLMGNRDFISTTDWPSYDKSKINVEAEESESLVKNLLEDTLNIIKATEITPKRICYYVSAPWKWNVYLKSLEKSTPIRVTLGNLIKELMTDPELKSMAGSVTKFVKETLDEINRMPDDRKKRRLQSVMNEKKILKEAKRFLEREFNVTINIYDEEDMQRYDPKKRASIAKPYRPAIYME
ncbi:leucine--tRNA ligase [Candidatus Bathyarchaeota archaeon]|nr:leucine--tRNA ligase [Candidatus Bathyarchaeota archaeon]